MLCDCEESVRLGLSAMIRDILLVPLGVPYRGDEVPPHITICEHCNRVLQGVNYDPWRVMSPPMDWRFRP